jgi:PPP family 3-phenylpropionic acid transporter
VRALAAERPRLPRAEVFPLALVGFLVSLLLLNASFTATWNFLTLRIAGLGGGLFLIGVAASLQAFAEIPALAAMPRLMAVLSHRALYVVGCAVYVAVFLAWAVLTDPLAISLIKIVIGVGYALTYVGSVVIVDDLVPGHLRATGQGLGKSMLAVAPVVGTLGGGLLYGLVSPATMFVAAAAATTAAGALAWLVVRTPKTDAGPAGVPTRLEQSARRV